MTREETALLDEARATLERAREVRARYRVTWYQMDDLAPEAEAELKQALYEAFRGWAGKHEITTSGFSDAAEVSACKAYEISSFSPLGDPARAG
jgi:hypothetical protein